MCKDYEELNLINFYGNECAKALLAEGFLNALDFRAKTVGGVLFQLRGDEVYRSWVDQLYREFYSNHIQNMLESEELSIDVVLEMTEIDSFSDYLIEKFIICAKDDTSVLEDNVLEFILQLLTAPGRFFGMGKRRK